MERHGKRADIITAEEFSCSLSLGRGGGGIVRLSQCDP